LKQKKNKEEKKEKPNKKKFDKVLETLLNTPPEPKKKTSKIKIQNEHHILHRYQ
jgi:hypothetical protein